MEVMKKTHPYSKITYALHNSCLMNKHDEYIILQAQQQKGNPNAKHYAYGGYLYLVEYIEKENYEKYYKEKLELETYKEKYKEQLDETKDLNNTIGDLKNKIKNLEREKENMRFFTVFIQIDKKAGEQVELEPQHIEVDEENGKTIYIYEKVDLIDFYEKKFRIYFEEGKSQDFYKDETTIKRVIY